MQAVSDAKAVLQNMFHRPSIVADIPQTGDTGDSGDHPKKLKTGALFSAGNRTLGGKTGEFHPKMSGEHRCIPTRF